MGVSRWIRDGKLKAYWTPGGYSRILKSDFRVFLKCYGLPVDPALFDGEEEGHVLVVGDDLDMVQAIKEDLEASGECQVTRGADAYDLSLMVATLHPEVIIVDMAMPGHNDCGLCCHVKVLGLVDSLSEEEGERSWRRGVTELLAKPLEGQDVYQHVCSTLEGKS